MMATNDMKITAGQLEHRRSCPSSTRRFAAPAPITRPPAGHRHSRKRQRTLFVFGGLRRTLRADAGGAGVPVQRHDRQQTARADIVTKEYL